MDPDGDDPSDGVDMAVDPDDLDTVTGGLPEWWRAAAEECDRFGLRTYRPPRFLDGALSPPIVERLEAEHGVRIDLIGVGVRYGDDWTVRVDGEPVESIGRHRDTDGYSVYELESEEFVDLVEAHVE